jgi:hypothetical protein
MGQSTDGILAYGYNLGGDDDGWAFQQTDKYGGIQLDWFHPGYDFIEEAQHRLEHAGQADLGVEFESYCSFDHTMWILAAKIITANRGVVKDVDMVELVEAPHVNGWDAKLAAPLNILGLTPTQDKPRWLLVSYSEN